MRQDRVDKIDQVAARLCRAQCPRLGATVPRKTGSRAKVGEAAGRRCTPLTGTRLRRPLSLRPATWVAERPGS